MLGPAPLHLAATFVPLLPPGKLFKRIHVFLI
jgi:hypothetical protein